MKSNFLQFDCVDFQFDSASEPLLAGLCLQFPSGWTGLVGANGSGKTTLLYLATGRLSPSRGRVVSSGSALYVEQRTDSPPEYFVEFLEDGGLESLGWIHRLGIGMDWPERWETLSHGERKRSQLAVALWRNPDILAVDEPGNHLDASAQRMVQSALRQFQGIGLLVGHDRNLLDALCRQCLFMEPPCAVMRPGGVSAGLEQAGVEQTALQREMQGHRREVARMEQEVQRQRERIEQSKAKNTKRHISKYDANERGRINMGRLTGKDAVGGRQKKQMESRLAHVRGRMDGVKPSTTYETGVWFSDAGYSPRSHLLRLPAGVVPLGDGRMLRHPALEMLPRDRIALTGDNGGGKSMLLKHILPHANVSPERLIYIPQEISAEESARLLEDIRKLPPDARGMLMTLVSRLGSRPHRLLESHVPSPGEVRKLLLAQGILRGPHLIVMDEPTNHMDLPGIQALEAALKECPCGLLLVSHDVRFLQALTTRNWHIADDGLVCR